MGIGSKLLGYKTTDYHLWHNDVMIWKHFPRTWPFVRGIHRSPVNSPHIGHWRGASMFSLICVWINDWVNNGKAGDLKRYRAHYCVIVMVAMTTPGWPMIWRARYFQLWLSFHRHICRTNVMNIIFRRNLIDAPFKMLCQVITSVSIHIHKRLSVLWLSQILQ